MRAEIVTAIGRLREIEPAWGALWSRLTGATPFTAPAWLLPWWDAFVPGKLFTVAVWHGESLIALAPLYLEDGRWGRRLLPLGIGLSDYADILIDPADASSAAAVLLDALVAQKTRWDQWSAEEAPPDATVLSLIVPPDWHSTLEPQSSCPVLALPSTVETLAQAIPGGMMRKWRMARNRTARRDWRLETDTADLPVAMADLFRLHGERWTCKGGTGVLADDDVRGFHFAAATRLAEAGLLRLNRLHIDGTIAGVYYGFRLGTRAYAYIGGFDPAFGFESPGTMLLGAAIEQAVGEGAMEFHFLRGREAYKYAWGAVDRGNCRRLFRVGP